MWDRVSDEISQVKISRNKKWRKKTQVEKGTTDVSIIKYVLSDGQLIIATFDKQVF